MDSNESNEEDQQEQQQSSEYNPSNVPNVPSEQIPTIITVSQLNELNRDESNRSENIINVDDDLVMVTPHVGAVEEVVSVNARSPQGVRTRRSLAAASQETDAADLTQTPEGVSPSSKKRKRNTPKKVDLNPPAVVIDDDDDDGSICPICLDSWEMSGKHRLVSIKCGHLFGQSCIQRWLRECPGGAKVCPSCKSRAATRDIRYIYAKKITVVDRSEEYRLQELIEQERTKSESLNMDNALLKMELSLQKTLYSKLEAQLDYLKAQGTMSSNSSDKTSSTHNPTHPKTFKLFMEKNIEISREPGCRVMTYAEQATLLLVSQKSNVSLFPGYGVRFLEAPTFRPGPFVHISEKQVRDLTVDIEEDYFVAASLDKSAKMFNIHNRAPVATFTPSDQSLWAASFDRERTKLLYLGSQSGVTYVYDIRNPNQVLSEHKTDNDLSPIVSICSIPPQPETIPFGGFLVCKLQSIWFYAYTSAQTVTATKLIVDGPFVAMNYDSMTNRILISTRPSFNNPMARYIVAELTKIFEVFLLKTITTFQGSKCLTVMSRSAQLQVDGNSLVAAYLQHSKTLTTWNIQSEMQMQALPISDVVIDLWPIYLKDNRVCLSALSENRCRIYHVQSSSS